MALDLFRIEEAAERLHPTLEALVNEDNNRTFEAVDRDAVSGVLQQLADEEALIRRGLDLAHDLEHGFRAAAGDSSCDDAAGLRTRADLWAARRRAYVRCGARTVWRAQRVAYNAELAGIAAAKREAAERARADRLAAVRAAVERALQQRAQDERAAQEERQRAEAEERQRAEAEERQRAEAEERQRAEAEERQRAEAEERQRAEAEERQRAEAEERQRAEAEEREHAEAEERRHAEAEERQRAEAEERRRAQAEERRRAEAAATERCAQESTAAERQRAEAAAAEHDALATSVAVHEALAAAAEQLQVLQANGWRPAKSPAKREAANGDGRRALLRATRRTLLRTVGRMALQQGRPPRCVDADRRATTNGPGPPRPRSSPRTLRRVRLRGVARASRL